MALDLLESSLDIISIVKKSIASSERTRGIDARRIQGAEKRLGPGSCHLFFAGVCRANEYMAEAQRSRNPVVFAPREVRLLEFSRAELEIRFDDTESNELDLLDEPAANQVISTIETQAASFANQRLFTNESIDPFAARGRVEIRIARIETLLVLDPRLHLHELAQRRRVDPNVTARRIGFRGQTIAIQESHESEQETTREQEMNERCGK